MDAGQGTRVGTASASPVTMMHHLQTIYPSSHGQCISYPCIGQKSSANWACAQASFKCATLLLPKLLLALHPEQAKHQWLVTLCFIGQVSLHKEFRAMNTAPVTYDGPALGS